MSVVPVPDSSAVAPAVSPLFRPTLHPPGGTNGRIRLWERARGSTSVLRAGVGDTWLPARSIPNLEATQIRQLASGTGLVLAGLELSLCLSPRTNLGKTGAIGYRDTCLEFSHTPGVFERLKVLFHRISTSQGIELAQLVDC